MGRKFSRVLVHRVTYQIRWPVQERLLLSFRDTRYSTPCSQLPVFRLPEIRLVWVVEIGLEVAEHRRHRIEPVVGPRFAWVILSLTGVLSLQYYDKVFAFTQPTVFGKLAFMFWLLIKGAKPPALDATASSSAAGLAHLERPRPKKYQTPEGAPLNSTACPTRRSYSITEQPRQFFRREKTAFPLHYNRP